MKYKKKKKRLNKKNDNKKIKEKNIEIKKSHNKKAKKTETIKTKENIENSEQISQEKGEEKKVFAKGICFQKLFLIFVIGCVVGTYYEQILYLVRNYIDYGTIVWESRRGVIYGPFSPIYGAGAVLFTGIFTRKKYKPWEVFIYGALIGGGFEYLISFLQETFIGTKSWDYSHMLLNINGRTNIPYMFFWGLCCMIYICYFYPKISNLIEKIPYKIGNKIVTFLVIFLSIDMLVSWTALFRQTLRREGIPPFTPIGEFYDYYYNDEFLHHYFPNMVPSNK